MKRKMKRFRLKIIVGIRDLIKEHGEMGKIIPIELWNKTF